MMEEELNSFKDAQRNAKESAVNNNANKFNLNDTDISEIEDDPFSHSSDLLNNDFGGKQGNVDKAANKFLENRFYANYDSEVENEELENLNKLVSINVM